MAVGASHQGRATGLIEGKLYVLVFTLRRETLRVIGLRRANKREETLYEKAQKTGSAEGGQR